MKSVFENVWWELPARPLTIEIDMEKQEQCKELYYVPPQNNDATASSSIFTIGGRDFRSNAVVHPLTAAKTGKQSVTTVTPRHQCTAAMVEELNPFVVHPGLADVVHVNFNNNTRITVLYCHPNSEHPSLKHIHTVYRNNKDSMEENGMAVERQFRHVDRLAGGWYVPLGLGCVPPGPHKCPRRMEHNGSKHQVPFLLRSVFSQAARKVQQIGGAMLGAVANALAEICPDDFKENANLRKSAEDCMYPTAEEQAAGQCQDSTAGGTSSTNSNKCWYANQTAFRFTGDTPLVDDEHDQEVLNLALHTDPHDFSTKMPIQVWPMGGEDGLGGPVPGSDLLVFANDTGGKGCRIKTTVHDCVVVILFNSAEQLHGSAGASVKEQQQEISSQYWCVRSVPYCGGKTVDFTRARAAMAKGYRPKAYVDLRGLKGLHTPLKDEEIVDGRRVAAPWGKTGKERLLPATVHRSASNSNEFLVQWDNGSYTPNWTKFVCDAECMNCGNDEVCQCLRESFSLS